MCPASLLYPNPHPPPPLSIKIITTQNSFELKFWYDDVLNNGNSIIY